jgi:3-hydroxy-3-methylglutaryl CoA synthase
MTGSAAVASIGTYLPGWGSDGARVCGPDEDAVTLAVAAGRGALRNAPPLVVERVVLVSRQLPLNEGGNGAVLLAGLGLAPSVDVVERLGARRDARCVMAATPARW